MKIWVDADACPGEVRQVLLRASRRLQIPLVFVANSNVNVFLSDLVSVRIVPPRADEADKVITEDVEEGDLVITADIELAANVVDKKADAIDPRGMQYTEDNVRSRLTMRNIMEDLRGAGMVSGGPGEYGDLEKQKFAATLDRLLTRRLRRR